MEDYGSGSGAKDLDLEMDCRKLTARESQLPAGGSEIFGKTWALEPLGLSAGGKIEALRRVRSMNQSSCLGDERDIMAFVQAS